LADRYLGFCYALAVERCTTSNIKTGVVRGLYTAPKLNLHLYVFSLAFTVKNQVVMKVDAYLQNDACGSIELSRVQYSIDITNYTTSTAGKICGAQAASGCPDYLYLRLYIHCLPTPYSIPALHPPLHLPPHNEGRKWIQGQGYCNPNE
jgi:hypothetical protein